MGKWDGVLLASLLVDKHRGTQVGASLFASRLGTMSFPYYYAKQTEAVFQLNFSSVLQIKYKYPSHDFTN